jgi:hypothetical protein
MADPVLTLKKNKERLARLQLVKQRAAIRTKKRIQQILDDQAEKEADKAGVPLDAPKKESK